MRRNILSGLTAVLLAVPAGLAHEIRVDFDHGANFTCYKTYSWADSADVPPQGTLFPNPLLRARIESFVEGAFAARGIKRVRTGGDLRISYGIEVTREPVYTTFSNGPGPGWGWDGGWGGGWGWGWGSSFTTTTVQSIDIGTLVINMVDANRRKLVFQGTSTQTISSRPEKNNKKLSKAVNEIFEKYPPRP
jgi:hypothetical protein